MSRARRIILSALVLGAGGLAAGAGTFSAFSATAGNSDNQFSAGTVTLGDDDAGAALVSLPANARPGDSSTRCINVSYSGSLPARVRLYASVSGGLADHLTLTVTRGSQASPSFPSCSGFAADGADYGYGSNGIVYQGKLSGLPASYAAGIADPDASWTGGEARSYRYAVTVDNTPAAQGLSASATFQWEARNL
jgi:predicted ribosomally synthesized peptide with SipW-like signal peptide